jgi:hypothetical protein
MAGLGVFDGDADLAGFESRWPFVKLPGNGLAPEVELRSCPRVTPATLAGSLSRPEAGVALAFAEVQGSDHHDWFEDLATALGIRFEHLMRDLVDAWLSEQANEEAARAFCADVRAQIRSE